MTTEEPDTDELLRQAAGGDPGAREGLLARHRDRLRKMIAWRLDRRFAARVDPSDVVQEVLLEASHKMDRYLRERPLPFFPWLRALAGEHLATLHRRHVRARGRSVLREEAEEVVESFLKARPDFALAPFDSDAARALAGGAPMLRLLPHVHGTDGYFLASLRRRAETESPSE